MACPSCNRKRFRERILKKGKKNFLIRVCLGCKKEYNLISVKKSTLTNEWIEKDSEEN